MSAAGAAPDHGITVFAPAKINLWLHVLGRRADGYHLIDSLVAFAEIGDSLTATPAAELSLALDGPFAASLPDPDDNLVLRAARMLAEAAGVAAGARLQLTKRLPVAAGIGGGSADAAAALRALMWLWRLDLREPELMALGLRLGADLPVCLAGRACVMGGIGETIAPVPPLPPVPMLLVNPGVPLATAAVFAARTPAFSPAPARWADAPVDAAALAARLGPTRNDLTAAAVALAPALGEALALVSGQPGCLLSRMSGSGATCFGLFEDAAAAAAAAAAIRAARPGWWVAATKLAGEGGAQR